MSKDRLGKTLSVIGGSIKPVLATAEAAADDEAGAAVRLEQLRYERQVLVLRQVDTREPQAGR